MYVMAMAMEEYTTVSVSHHIQDIHFLQPKQAPPHGHVELREETVHLNVFLCMYGRKYFTYARRLKLVFF